MQETILGVTKLVNWLLGKPALAVLAFLHIQPSDPRYPIPNHIAVELFVFLFAIVFFLWLRQRLSSDRPGDTQQCVEFLLTNPLGIGVKDLLVDIVGHDGEKHLAFLGSITIFILLSNLASLVPGMMSPTASPSVPFACAVIVFVYYHRHGFLKHGPLKYSMTFTGPKELDLPLPFRIIMRAFMLIIEAFSHFARMLSLTARLFANMLVGELLYTVFLGLSVAIFVYLDKLNPAGYLAAIVPLFLPLLLLLLHFFEAFIQAFIFTILPVIYVSGAVAEEH